MPKFKPSLRILKKLDPNAKSLSCFADYISSSSFGEISVMLRLHEKKVISENAFNNGLSYYNKNLNDNSVFQFACKQLLLSSDATTNLCFYLELKKRTVLFFYTNIMCKAFSF